jgi:superfamily II DNA/RNA helicase
MKGRTMPQKTARSMSASKDFDVSLKRIRREFEPENKAAGDHVLDRPWVELPLSKHALFAVDAVLHFSHATHVQAEVIPSFKDEGTSCIVEAATGSGKTLAFVVPLLERVLQQVETTIARTELPVLSRNIVACILAPSRVLAQQTFIVARNFGCRFPHNIRVQLVDSKVESIEETTRRLGVASKGGGVIVVSTPADFAAILEATSAEASGPQVVAHPGYPFAMIIDEADVVLRHKTTYEAVEKIARTVAARCSSMDVGLFGATATTVSEVDEFLKVIDSIRVAPKPLLRVSLGSIEASAQDLRNLYTYCQSQDVLQSLVNLLNAHPSKKHFIFFNSPDVLCYVKELFDVLIGGKFPMLKTRALFALHEKLKDSTKFSEFGKFVRAEGGAVLLCTDEAAFGLDVRDVDYVTHFEIPASTQSYVHRIGRVARMGMRGCSVLLVPVRGAEASGYLSALGQRCTLEELPKGAGTVPLTASLRGFIMGSQKLQNALPHAVAALHKAQPLLSPDTAVAMLTCTAVTPTVPPAE